MPMIVFPLQICKRQSDLWLQILSVIQFLQFLFDVSSLQTSSVMSLSHKKYAFCFRGEVEKNSLMEATTGESKGEKSCQDLRVGWSEICQNFTVKKWGRFPVISLCTRAGNCFQRKKLMNLIFGKSISPILSRFPDTTYIRKTFLS